MTRKKRADTRAGRWAIQDAKARLSEVIRKAKTDGPQLITVYGREAVFVISLDEWRRISP